MKLLKLKAMFEIFLVLSLMFIFSLSVSADSSEEGFVCCMDPKGSDDEPCQYVDPLNCDDANPHEGTCDSLSLCQPAGCCDLSNVPNLIDNSCKANVGKSTCDYLGGDYLPDKTCNSYPQCSVGCCNVGSQCQLTTQSGCNTLFGNTDLETNFDPAIRSEYECLNLCIQQEKGCCVSGDEYKYITQEECGVKNGEFFYGETCDRIENSPCEPEASYSCIGDDVYYFDSCDNQGEMKEECKYEEGEICGTKVTNGEEEVTCIDMRCSNTWDNPAVDENGDGDLENDNEYFAENPRNNFETWCEYDANAGPMTDLPGTRHYRHYCENGQEKVDECGTYRDSICVQGDLLDNGRKIGTSAACRENRAADCFEQMNNLDCHDSTLRECVWLSSAEDGQAEKIIKQTEERLRKLAEEDGVIIPPNEDEEEYSNKGKCIPLVPLGLQHWSEDPVQRGVNNCIVGSPGYKEGIVEPVETIWIWQDIEGEWDCEGGCDVFSNKFLKDSNLMCGAYADCGAKYNVAGIWSKFGYERDIKITEFNEDEGEEELFELDYQGDTDTDGDINGISLKDEDDGFYDFVDDGTGKWKEDHYYESVDDLAYKFLVTNNEKWPLDSNDFATKFRYYDGLLKMNDINIEDYDSNFLVIPGILLGVSFLAGTAIFVESIYASSVVISSMVLAGASEVGAIATVSSLSSATLSTAAGTSWIPIIGWIIAIVSLVSAVFITITTWPHQEELYVQFDCKPWQAPKNPGQQMCELCNEPSADGKIDLTATLDGRQLHECTPYLCESLGKSCDFQTTAEGPKCLNSCGIDNPESDDPVFVAISPEFKEQQENKNNCKEGVEESSSNEDCAFNEGAENGIRGSGGVTLQYYRANSDLEIKFKTCKDSECNEPAYADCRISNVIGDKFDSKSQIGTGLAQEHILNLEADIDLKQGEEYNAYIQCRNFCEYPDLETLPDYKLTIKVAKEPDRTAPIFVNGVPQNGGYLPNSSLLIAKENTNRYSDLNYLKLQFDKSVDECKYGFINAEYDLLTHPADCHGDDACDLPLWDMKEGENVLYVKCKDIAGNVNTQNLPDDSGYKLIGTKGLEISSFKCLHNLGENCDAIYQRNFTLELTTNDYGNNLETNCGSGLSKIDYNYLETGSTTHRQFFGPLIKADNLIENVYCQDVAGNFAKLQVKYSIKVDNDIPLINRVYQEGDYLFVETNEKASCKYINYNSNNLEDYSSFDLTGDLLHSTNIVNNNFFRINCADIFSNSMFLNVYVTN